MVKSLVFGVDVHPSTSPLSKPVYSLAIVDREGRVERCFETVSLRKLLKLAGRLKPSAIATDNLYELAENTAELLRIKASLPDGVKLVQVTGPPSSLKPLELVAREYGFKVGGKLNPLDTAKLVAKLAWLGAGYTVEVHEPETIVTIAKAKAVTAGGMSQARFKRELRSLVLQATNQVKELLSNAGIDYDLYEKRSKYGLDKSTFVVYAPRYLLKRALRPLKLLRVSVKIASPSSESLKLNDKSRLKSPKRYLIVGIDPGVVTGLAILSLNGVLLALLSSKTLTRGAIIREVANYGVPLVVASDVPTPSDLVRKVASTLNAVVYAPERPLSVSDKLALAQGYQNAPSNSHELDALAAAMKAYAHYKNKLEQVEARVREVGLKVSVEELERLKAMVVKGTPIQDAIDALRSSKEGEVKEEAVKPPSQNLDLLKKEAQSLRSKIEVQRRVIESLERDNAQLKQHIATLNSKIESLELALQRLKEERDIKVKRDAEVQLLELRVNQLQRDLSESKASLKEATELLSKWRLLLTRMLKREVVVLKSLSALTMTAIKDALNTMGISRDDVVLVVDATSASVEAAEALARLKISCLITGSAIPEGAKAVFQRHLIPVLSASDVHVEWLEGIPYVESGILKDRIKDLKAKMEEEEAVKAREALKRILKERHL